MSLRESSVGGGGTFEVGFGFARRNASSFAFTTVWSCYACTVNAPNKVPKKAPLVSMRILAILLVLVPLLIYGGLATFRYFESSAAAELRVSRSLRVAHEHAIVVAETRELMDLGLGHGSRPRSEMRTDWPDGSSLDLECNSRQ